MATGTVGRAGPMHANATAAPLGTRPPRSPEGSVQAERSTAIAISPPDLNAAQHRGRAMMRQIKKQAPVFMAILFLSSGRSRSAGYILSNQRFYLPAWVPLIGTDFFVVEAELLDRPGRGAGTGPDA